MKILSQFHIFFPVIFQQVNYQPFLTQILHRIQLKNSFLFLHKNQVLLHLQIHLHIPVYLRLIKPVVFHQVNYQYLNIYMIHRIQLKNSYQSFIKPKFGSIYTSEHKLNHLSISGYYFSSNNKSISRYELDSKFLSLTLSVFSFIKIIPSPIQQKIVNSNKYY